MGIFDKIFGSSQQEESRNNNKGLNWDSLESVDQLNNIIENSTRKVKVIFKHSTRCGISRMVLNNFEKSFAMSGSEASYYMLDLLEHRDVSDAIASSLSVVHQSPQIIVIDNKQVIYTESHHGIDASALEKILNKN